MPAPNRYQTDHYHLEEITDLAIASVCARHDAQRQCCHHMRTLLNEAELPVVESAVIATPYSAFWVAHNQWFVTAPAEQRDDLDRQAQQHFGQTASVTLQSDAWYVISLSGNNLNRVLERLVNADLASMPENHFRRTLVEQISCYLHCQTPNTTARLWAARSFHAALWHAAKTAVDVASEFASMNSDS